MAGYQAVGDWLGKRQDRDYLPVADMKKSVRNLISL